ncbi:hypothetical protein Q31a_51700 [Aureliella helgolandensis]|uniref:Uncharacterized protein n=1 Tax=Aureliella helgolandensis TaxID=2527968 RepID=A0A518GDW5_9BACT|nr:hypothetical protein Q31a_51700 [Aureliella helgolandensis]
MWSAITRCRFGVMFGRRVVNPPSRCLGQRNDFFRGSELQGRRRGGSTGGGCKSRLVAEQKSYDKSQQSTYGVR